MPQDFANRQPAPVMNPGSPRWVWFVTGVFVGVFGSFLVYLWHSVPADPDTEVVSAEKPEAHAARAGDESEDFNWQFYDLSNVVLNVHDVTPTPSLQPNETYKFVLMGVSEDNWVNLMGERTFQTH